MSMPTVFYSALRFN